MNTRTHLTALLKRATALAAAAALLTLTGCSADYWPTFKKNSSELVKFGGPDAALTQEQLSRIVRDIARDSNEADAQRNAQLLQNRFTSAAFRQREANYKIHSKEEGYSVALPHILDTFLGYELVQSTNQWPRSVFVALASSKDTVDPSVFDRSTSQDAPAELTQVSASGSPSLGLLLQQTTPQNNYKVERIVYLRSGITMPEATVTELGTAVLDNNISSLLLSPQEATQRYANILQNGLEAGDGQDFDMVDDPLLAIAGVNWRAREEERTQGQDARAKYSANLRLVDAPLALSTGAGGALVTATLHEDRITEAENNSELPVNKIIEAVSGLTGKKTKIVQQIEHQILLYVPSKGRGEKIRLLGSASELIGASE